MKQKEREDLLRKLLSGGSVSIGQLAVGDHNTLNYYSDGKKTETKTAPHFPLNKSEDEGRQWYNHLKGNGFIPEDTEQACWLYVMGFSTKMPDEPKPVVWLKTVETARMMMRKVCDNLISTNQMSVAGMYTLASQCFCKDGKPLKLAKPKKEISPDADLIENFLPTISDL